MWHKYERALVPHRSLAKVRCQSASMFSHSIHQRLVCGWLEVPRVGDSLRCSTAQSDKLLVWNRNQHQRRPLMFISLTLVVASISQPLLSHTQHDEKRHMLSNVAITGLRLLLRLTGRISFRPRAALTNVQMFRVLVATRTTAAGFKLYETPNLVLTYRLLI